MIQQRLQARLNTSLGDSESQPSLIMGVLNVTPDSFSDGGRFNTVDSALRHAQQLLREGADILDIGGESTRPGAAIVSEQEELDRVIPVLEKIKQHLDVPVSVDTRKKNIMRAAITAGADMINDVTALQDAAAQTLLAENDLPVCLMHMQGQPDDMQQQPHYAEVVTEVMAYLQRRIDDCITAGIKRPNIVLDPGIGFGKTLVHNLALLAAVPEFKQLGCSVLIGVSRKSMIDHLLKRPVEQRLPASLGLAVQAVLNGADIVRVHDVRATFDAVRAAEAVQGLQIQR